MAGTADRKPKPCKEKDVFDYIKILKFHGNRPLNKVKTNYKNNSQGDIYAIQITKNL